MIRLLRAAWPVIAVALAFILCPGCGKGPTTDNALWIGCAIGAAILLMMLGVIAGFRMGRSRTAPMDPEMPEVKL